MTTIHTARNIVGNDKTTPLFSLKGLPNLVPSTITSLTIQGIPLEKQVAYTQYSANISSFIYATAIGKTITVSPAPLGRLSYTFVLPLDPPTVSFTLQKPLDSDRSDKFINILGPGASKTQSGKTTIYHAPSIPMNVIDSVTKLSTPFFNSGRDAVNPKGFIAFRFLNNVIHLFLRVHSYSAFHNESTESITSFEQLLGGTIGGAYFSKETKSTDKDGKETVKITDLKDKSHSVNEFNKRERDADEMADEDTPMAKIANESLGFLRFKGNETVFKATPVKKPIMNIGASSEVPVSPGHVFPYFQGLIQPDTVFMNSVVLRRFYQVLGSTHEFCQSAYLDIRHGINSLATTNRGMELCHILLGIDLAIETQTRCFLIIEKNQYLGFSLLGARYAIFCNTRWYAPALDGELIKAIRKMDPHESAVEDMIAKFEELHAKSQYTGSVDKSIFAEPKLLVDALSHLKITDIDDDDVRDLDRYIRNLNYMGTGYLTKNPQMIAEMLETISSNKSVELSRPTFLPSIKAPMTSKLFALLSRFGPEAPSFWNDRGKEIICKSVDKSVVTTGGKRKIGESDIYGNMPNRVLITPKPLLVAVKDMEKVLDKGRVKMDVDERAGRYRNISVEHEDTRKRLWKGLVDICADSGKKLRVTDDNLGASESIDLDAVMASLLG